MAARTASEEMVAARHAVRQHVEDLGSDKIVIVACSGGPDSLALTAVAAWVGERAGLTVRAVVVDHQAQVGSAEVAARAAKACRTLGVSDVDIVDVEVGTHGGFEAAARRARYEALEQAARTYGANAVLLGHTLDDQAETVLLRMARGSGARSLAAMSAVSGLWRRPFLSLRRSVVHAVADEALAPHGLQAWKDPHNADDRFARVRVRSTLTRLEADLGDAVVESLGRTAELLRADADALDALADAAWHQHVLLGEGEVGATINDLSAMPDAIRWRVIRRMAIELDASEEDIGYDVVRRVDAFVTDWHGQGAASLPSGIQAQRVCGRLSLHRPHQTGSREG